MVNKKGEEQLRKLIAEHPDLPIMCLAPSTPCDYSTYYHDVCGASIERMLFPNEVNRMYPVPCKGLPNGLAFKYFGLNPERYYDDIDEVAAEIEDWLWDNTDGETKGKWPDAYEMHAVYDMRAWVEVYRPIARMMAEDMPWHEYIVIDCC